LEHHPRNEHPLGSRVDCLLYDHPRPEASRLDVEIEGEELELTGERDFVGRRVADGLAKEIAETGESAARERHVPRHQARYGVERVEQEMRLQLPAQRVELRFGEEC